MIFFSKQMLFIFSFLSFSYLQTEQPIIHVFGDSHCSEFWQVPGCTSHHLGAITMHRVGRDGLNILNFPQYGVQEGQIVVLTFGEIDVRCHIGKQIDLFNRSREEVIETLAYCYFETILLNLSFYQNLTCIVYSVTPPLDFYHVDYPPYGNLLDRVALTKELNSKLNEFCSQLGIRFLDVYDDYATPDGTLIRHISDGVHILPTHYHAIQEKLYKIISN